MLCLIATVVLAITSLVTASLSTQARRERASVLVDGREAEQVSRQLLFGPFTTTALRITVTGTMDLWTRLTEVEAYTPTATTVIAESASPPAPPK